jgi:hypothetical protein
MKWMLWGAMGVVLMLFAGCSGGTNPGAAPAAPAARGLQSHVRTQTIVADGSGSITVTGPISNFISGGFTMNEGKGGGFVHVLTSGSTVMSGAAPFVGENVVVSGTGVAGGNITASSVAQQIVAPAGVLSLMGPISSVSAQRFTIDAPGYGYTHVAYTTQTPTDGGPPANGEIAQAVGPGTTSETSAYDSFWPSAPATLTETGTVVAATSLGFTLDVDAGHKAVPIVVASSTKFSAWPVAVQKTATVTGAGSLDRSIVASAVSAPSPTPAPTATPSPAPAVSPVVLSPGGVVGLDNQFAPPDGDTPAGGTGQTVDGIPCAPSMTENMYHVHAYLGLLVNGRQIAIPDQIGLNVPGPIVSGFTSTAQCYYEIHFHDTTGMIHIESPSTASLASTIYPLGTVFDIWGMTLSSNNVGPYAGQVRVFIDQVPLKTLVAGSYTEYLGNPSAIPLYSHEAIWLEVGPTFVTAPNIPAVEFYTEY